MVSTLPFGKVLTSFYLFKVSNYDRGDNFEVKVIYSAP